MSNVKISCVNPVIFNYTAYSTTQVATLSRLKKLSKLIPKIQNIKGPEKASKHVKS